MGFDSADEHDGLIRPASDTDDEPRQTPTWSLAPFGWQRRQPAAHRGGGGGDQPRKDAARLPLKRHGSGADSPSELHSEAMSWRRGCRLLRGVLLVCALLAVLSWAANRAGARAPQVWAQPQQAAPPPQQQQCRLQLDGSPWERHCQRLRRVCFDQGGLILYDERYQQLDGRRAGELPEVLVDTSKLYEYPWRKTSSKRRSSSSSSGGGGGGGGSRRSLKYVVQEPTRTRRLAPLPLRPATSQEPTPYLQEPAFSTCTVPLLLYPSWRANFFHVFKDLSAVYFALLRRTPWRHHAKLVVVTPEGLPLTQAEAQLLPPLSRLSVQSLADFSRRLAPGHPPGQQLDPAQPPASYEGGEQRCFQDVYVCGRNFPLGPGLAREEEAELSPQQRSKRLAETVPLEPWTYGQAVVAWHQQAGAAARRMRRRPRPPPALQDGISLLEAAEAAAAAGPAPAVARARSSGGRLRVLVIKRGGEGRQILNAPELLRRCNAWRYQPPGGGPAVTAECSEVTTPDLASGIAMAREADVIVGMHGANLANGWMARPGASVVEIMPYQFETGRGAFVFSSTNAQDATSQVLWWVGVVCDPAASTPGPTELARAPPEDWWPRDRNARVPWALLEAALREAVAAGGDKRRYQERYYDRGLHKWHLLPGGALRQGGRCNSTLPG